MLPLPRPTWLDTVNEEARALAGAPDVDAGVLRRALIAAVSREHPFPLRLVFRGYVIGARTLEAPVLAGGPEERRMAMRVRKVQRFLEVVPEGFTREAWELLGPVLVPTYRPLQEGSVVTVAVDLQDPSTYHLDPHAILADLVEMQVGVAVEP